MSQGRWAGARSAALSLDFLCKGVKPLYTPLSSAKGTVFMPCPCLGAIQKLGETEEDFQIQASLSLSFYTLFLRPVRMAKKKKSKKQSISQMPVLWNIKQVLNSLEFQV